MFKFISGKYQLAFLAVLVVNIVCSELGDLSDLDDLSDLGDLSELGILEETDIDPENQPPVPCRYNCTRPYSPLCGSDGKTYGNICHLNTKNRCDNTRIVRRSNGTCPHQRCVIRDPHLITCECHRPRPTRCFLSSNPNRNVTCSNDSRPVCGTNGVTYLNACRLVFDTACLWYPVRVCHQGPCRRFDDEDSEKVSIAHESDE